MQGTGGCAGSCDDLTVAEEQITIGKRDDDPTEILGETERPLFFKSQKSPFRGRLGESENAVGRISGGRR
jgi:hypothetical protein